MPLVSGDTAPFIAALVGGVTILLLVAQKFFGHDSREPPLAPQSIPIIGHIIGMARKSFNYQVDLSNKMNSPPIYTMPLPGQKMYVVTKPELIQTIQKQHKVLSFAPIEAKFSTIVCGVTPETAAIVTKNMHGDDPGPSIFRDTHFAYEALKPGPALDAMNRAMIHQVASALDDLQPPKGTSHHTISLNAWIQETITLATTRAVYGPLNPFEDKSIADSFWEFEHGFLAVLTNILPSLLARKPIAARDRVADAFVKYFQSGGVEQASLLAQRRYTASTANGVSLKDLSRFEVGGSLAILVNTSPAVFWTLLLIHAHPGLRNQIRAEIDACTTTTTVNGKLTKTIEITTLKDNCPLLLSAYQETLRHRAMGTSVREVTQDTHLDGWLLKKGAMLQMPTRVIHSDGSLWGVDVDQFNPRRFLAEEKGNRPKDICFRTFGGGKTLCPGRHFATNEVLAVVAVWVARFDMEPATGSVGGGDGEWVVPTAWNTNVASVLMEPDTDVEVSVEVRREFEGKEVEWKVRLNASEKVFAMVTEDIVGAE